MSDIPRTIPHALAGHVARVVGHATYMYLTNEQVLPAISGVNDHEAREREREKEELAHIVAGRKLRTRMLEIPSRVPY